MSIDVSLKDIGINKLKIKQFNDKGIYTAYDLINYFPRKYLDYRNTLPISKLKDKDNAAIIAKVISINERYNYIKIKVKDEFNNNMYMVWFNNIKYIKMQFEIDREYIFCGTVKKDERYKITEIVNPIFDKNIESLKKIFPVYSKIEGMSDSYLKNAINKALEKVTVEEYLDEDIIKKFNIPNIKDTIKIIHMPNSTDDLKKASKRIIFDELYKFNIELNNSKKNINKTTSFIMKRTVSKEFIDSLPFKLTEDQRSVLKDIYLKMKYGKRVDALIQGDVGCGKTIIGIILMLTSYENGFQSALMCPTNVLAKQHYYDLIEKLKAANCKVALLTGELKLKERKEILEKLKNGEIDMVVGTHALIQKDVVYKNLALTIVDEEHRFGVMQREELILKAEEGVHNISMTATPIPRSLALAVYGDAKDIFTIKSMPIGRKAIKTILYSNELKVYESIYNQIKESRQCYVICPLIEDSDVLEDIDSVEKTYKKMTKWFSKYDEVKIGILTGKMKDEELSNVLSDFSKNKIHILISTTVVEVGVNVPNATVIMIKNAERFGLSQLHQLRGRVGRGNYQSYCVLLSYKKDDEKLKIMTETNDGFIIAKKDLELRGSGEFFGFRQTGENRALELMLQYPELNKSIKEIIEKLS